MVVSGHRKGHGNMDIQERTAGWQSQIAVGEDTLVSEAEEEEEEKEKEKTTKVRKNGVYFN